MDWERLAAHIRTLRIHDDLGEYAPLLPRRAPEERTAFALRIRELIPEYDQMFHLDEVG